VIRRLTALCLLFLAGCAGGHVDGSYDRGPIEDSGLLIVACGNAGASKHWMPMRTYFQDGIAQEVGYVEGSTILVYRYLKSGELVPVPIWGDYPDDNPVGSLQVLRLAPGKYEFFRFDAYEEGNGAGGFSVSSSIRSQRPFSIPFEIKSGSALYIGRLLYHFTDDGTVQLHVLDKSSEDLAVWKRDFPELASTPVEVAVPHFEP
jgi:hypothetical protein